MSVATPTAPPNASARNRMIADRQKNSPAWWIVHRLGSLQFALVLLATIAIACAMATFTESKFNTKIAQAYIYKAAWFQIWLIALCVNLAAVTITRWPWQKKHIGFVVTHYGIITLLIGAMVGMKTGYEGNVTLRKDEAPTSRVTTSRSIIQFESPAEQAQYITDFDATTAQPGESKPRVFPIPKSGLKIVVDGFSENLVREQKLVPSETPDAAPSVLLRLSTKMMGQTVDMPLSLVGGQSAQEDFFGLARIVFANSLPANPETPAETQMVFAKFAPVVQSGDNPTGLSVRLSEDGSKIAVVYPDGSTLAYHRSEVMNQPITEGGFVVVVEKYWPDFEMKDGKPGTRSDQPNNPAALIRVSKADGDAKPLLSLAPDGENGVAYRLSRGNHVTATGKASAGQSFALGWADWQAEVVQALPRAVSVSEVKPGPELDKGAHGIPGFRAHLETNNGERGPSRWIESGEVASLTDGQRVIRVGYGLERRPLPFSIRLVKFEVPRDEGTNTPSNFLATVEFQDAKTGATKTGVAKMNHPASFPGTLLANLTGINYKFSQAEWNPQNLDETTLQVLYDPGWSLKWIGSLGICVGIAIMFYWKPK